MSMAEASQPGVASPKADVRATLAKAKSEVEALRKLVPSATLNKRYCSEILEASDACLLQLEQVERPCLSHVASKHRI